MGDQEHAPDQGSPPPPAEREATVYRVLGERRLVCCMRPGAAGELELDVSLTSILQACLTGVSETNPASVVLQEPIVWSAEAKAFRCPRVLRVGDSWIRKLRVS